MIIISTFQIILFFYNTESKIETHAAINPFKENE